MLHLRLGQGHELGLERVARLLLCSRDDASVVISNAHVVDADLGLERQEEVREGVGVARRGELSGRGKAGDGLGGPARQVRLVVDLVQRDVGKDRGLVGELAEDELVRFVDRDGDHDDEGKHAHQHVPADERAEQARR